VSVRRFLISSAAALVLSVAAKFIADAFLADPWIVDSLQSGLLLSHNPGIAFGLRIPSPGQEILIIAALVLVSWLALHRPGANMEQTGYGLIVGGALTNVIDRIPDGFVTDFVKIGSFPIFNMADACITVGAILLVWYGVRARM